MICLLRLKIIPGSDGPPSPDAMPCFTAPAAAARPACIRNRCASAACAESNVGSFILVVSG